MARVLKPHPKKPYLEPEVIVDLLSDEFAHAEVDQQRGAEIVADGLAKLIELKAPQPVLDQMIAGLDRSFSVFLADDPTAEYAYLDFVVTPETRILVGFSSYEHEQAALPLLERCARAISYETGFV